jgi:hypothetical protein
MDRIKGGDDEEGGSFGSYVGMAVSRFVKRQNPESVEFDLYENGYQITVKTEGDKAKKAKEFWEENVKPRL